MTLSCAGKGVVPAIIHGEVVNDHRIGEDIVFIARQMKIEMNVENFHELLKQQNLNT